MIMMMMMHNLRYVSISTTSQLLLCSVRSDFRSMLTMYNIFFFCRIIV